MRDKISELLGSFERAEERNRENLRKILRDNAATEYGKRMGFAQIRSGREYARRVPLTEYADYKDLCVPGNYTVYPVSFLLETSGTMGAQKVFPLTEESLSRYDSLICETGCHVFGGWEGPHLHTSLFRGAKDGRTILSAGYYRWMREHGLFDEKAYAGGGEFLFADGIPDVAYVKAWIALCYRDLVSIQSIFLYDLLLFLDFLEKNWEGILADMRARRVSAELSDEKKAALLGMLPGDDVLSETERILKEGFDTPILRRLWPKLRFLQGIGGGVMSYQEERLKRFAGNIPVCYFAYASSECMIGAAPWPGVPWYVLLPDSAYYEFLEDGERLVDFADLEPGKLYEPVVTTFSGLYRYRMGDLLRIVCIERDMPVFEVCGRRKILNIAGEKLDEGSVSLAVGEWADRAGVSLLDYSVGTDQRTLPGRYLLFAETEEIPDETGAVKPSALPQTSGCARAADGLAGIFDDCLARYSPDYQDVRSLRMLRPPQVIFCAPGTLAALWDKGHKKHHTFLGEKETEQLVEDYEGKSSLY